MSGSGSDIDTPLGKPRTLVLCFDGTSNEYDADVSQSHLFILLFILTPPWNTNVVKLYALLKKDIEEQLCYYQAGVGTWFEPGVVSPLFEWGAKVLDLAFAWYLDAHVIDGYKFLMQNYRAGDKICIFGFSRGAYTARALGGFLYKVGLLPKDNYSQVPFAFKMYQRTDEDGLKLCAGFKETYCQIVEIEFMGVWDTVSSVGVLAGRTLPYTNSNVSIKTFRHALSLDEHRAKFRPNNYYRSPLEQMPASVESKKPEFLTTESNAASRSSDESSSSSSSTSMRAEKKKAKKKWRFLGSISSSKKGKSIAPFVLDSGEPTDVMEVWFAGCHSDVGGGALANDVAHDLANISLRWMVREILAADCGIKFDIPSLMKAKLDLNPEPSAQEIEMDLSDALEPIHDELKLDRLWWLLEIIPLTYSWQDASGLWHRDFGFNFGKGRTIADPQPTFHATVKRRMESSLNYTPRANFTKGTEVYVH